MHAAARRRKKHVGNRVKSVEVARGRNGYGFTISGQYPCILSCIVAGSPAERTGLHAGDYLLSVNSRDISKMTHDDVVKLIGTSTGNLILQISENVNSSSDSSDNEYQVQKQKQRHPARVRPRSVTKQQDGGKAIEKVLDDLHAGKLFSGAGAKPKERRYKHRSHSPDPWQEVGYLRDNTNREHNGKRSATKTNVLNIRAIDKENMDIAKGKDQEGSTSPKAQHAKRRCRTPDSTQIFGGARAKEYGVKGQVDRGQGQGDRNRVRAQPQCQQVSGISVQELGKQLRQLDAAEAQAYLSTNGVANLRAHSVGPVQADGNYQTIFTPQELRNILYPSITPQLAGSSLTLNQGGGGDNTNEPNLRVVVGYIGSIEMPSDCNLPSSRLQSIRSAVRRLRVEQKIHTLVLMEVFRDAVKLTNSVGTTIAIYTADKIAFSGVCPDDKRFFGLVTCHTVSSDEASEDDTDHSSSSCHVFMVDPDLRAHNVHAKKAKAFGFKCTQDPETNRCLEFPRSATPILRVVAKLYRERQGGLAEPDLVHGNGFVGAHRSNSASSNSDSGLGFWREDNSNGDRVFIVDMPAVAGVNDSYRQRWVEKHARMAVMHRHQPSDSSQSGVSNSQLSPPRARQQPLSSMRQQQASAMNYLSDSSQSDITGAAIQRSSRSRSRSPGRSNLHNGRNIDFQDTSAVNRRTKTQYPMQRPQVMGTNKMNNVQTAKSKKATNDKSEMGGPPIQRRLSAFKSTSPNGPVEIKSSQNQISPVVSPDDKLNVRARPDPSLSASPKTPLDQLEHQNSAENLRRNMYQILQTRQRQLFDSVGSDQESYADTNTLESRGHQLQGVVSRDKIKTSRPLSCPIENIPLMSDPMSVPGNQLVNKVLTNDLASKLSPRAFPITVAQLNENLSRLQHPGNTQENTNGSMMMKFSSSNSQFHKPQPPLPKTKPALPPKSFSLSGTKSASIHNVQKMVAMFETSKKEQDVEMCTNKSYSPSDMRFRPNPGFSTPNQLMDPSTEMDQSTPSDDLDKTFTASSSATNTSESGTSSSWRHRDPDATPRVNRYGFQGSHRPQTLQVTPNQKAGKMQRGLEVTPKQLSDSSLLMKTPNTVIRRRRDDGRPEKNELRWALGESPALKASRKKLSLSVSHESLVIGSDVEYGNGGLSSASSIASIASESSMAVHDRSAGRVSGWAVSFDKLLHDPVGQSIFTDFLKKEYSEENMVFWLACERYRHIKDPDERTSLATEIYDNHLAKHASDPVNVDSTARQLAEDGLDETSPGIFQEAQKQIWQLMKTDSYVRFLRSDEYKQYIQMELDGKPLPDVAEDRREQQMKKNDSISSTVSNDDEKKRRSLLPWNRNKGTKRSTKSITSVSSSERSSLASGDLNLISREISISHESLTKQDSNTSLPGLVKKGESQKFCRVIMPDDSTTVIYAKAGQLIRTSLAKLCERRALSLHSLSAHMMSSDKPLDLSKDVSSLGNKEIRLEKRTLFRLDLPNRSVGVRSKPNRIIRDVLKPILSRHGQKIDSVVVHMVGSSNGIDPDLSVSILDGQQVAVQNKEDFAAPLLAYSPDDRQEWGGFDSRRAHAVAMPGRHSVPTVLPTAVADLETMTTRIDDIISGKDQSECQFDDLGVFDPQSAKNIDKGRKETNRPSGIFSMWRRNSLNDKEKKAKQNETMFSSQRVNNNNGKREQDEFFSLLSKVQNSRIDDQRGSDSNQFELPDFLKEKDLGQGQDYELQGEGRRSPQSPGSAKTIIMWNKKKTMQQPMTNDGQKVGGNRKPPVYKKPPVYSKTNGVSALMSVGGMDRGWQSTVINIGCDAAKPRINHRLNSEHTSGHESQQRSRFKSQSSFQDFPHIDEAMEDPLAGIDANFKYKDNSFRDDGVLPSHEQAEQYFAQYNSFSGEVDYNYNDPQLMNKSMSEVGMGDLKEHVSSTRKLYTRTANNFGHMFDHNWNCSDIAGDSKFDMSSGNDSSGHNNSSGGSNTTPIWEPAPHESDWIVAQAKAYAKQEAEVRQTSFGHLNGAVTDKTPVSFIPPPPVMSSVIDTEIANFPPPPSFQTPPKPLQLNTSMLTNKQSAEEKGRSPYSRRFPRQHARELTQHTPTLPGRSNDYGANNHLIIYNSDDDMDAIGYESPPSPSTHDLLPEQYIDYPSPYLDFKAPLQASHKYTDKDSRYNDMKSQNSNNVKITFV